MKNAIDARAPGIGYDPHFGAEDSRRKMASIISRMYKTPENDVEADWEHVTLTNGATLGVNAAIEAAKFSPNDPEGVVLLSSPGYPPYESIVKMHGVNFKYYYLKKEEGYFISYESLKSSIVSSGLRQVRLVIYNYPHNPTGATPNEQEAKDMANTINRISSEFPDIIFLEECLYYGTINSDFPLWSPYSSLDNQTRNKTIIVGSGSKIGLAGPRAGFIYSSDKTLASLCANYVSLTAAGTGYIPHIGYISVLEEIDFHPGQKNISEKNPRHHIANFFQARINYVASKLRELAQAAGVDDEKVIDKVPLGGMYLWVDLEPIFKNREIPKALQAKFPKNKTHFDNVRDLQLSLLLMSDLEQHPVIIAPGDIFGEKDGMKVRISCVLPDFDELQNAIQSFFELSGLARFKAL